MTTANDVGTIVTVDGCIDPEDLGVCLPHEHTLVDLSEAWFDEPDSAVDRALAREPVSLENLWYVRRNPQQHRDNFRIGSVDVAVEELGRYHRAGGDAVVDLTPKNAGGDPKRVRGIARETALTYVHGTAYYVRKAHPERVDEASVDELADEFVSDVRTGIDDTAVRAGIVGEIGLSGHVHPAEKKVLRAGARAARRTGAPLNIHPPGRTEHAQRDRTYPPSRWALELLDVIEEEGLPPDRIVVSHMDRTIYLDTEYQRELADRGAYLEYDLWGTELYLEAQNDSYPSDARRLEAVAGLIEDGYTDRLLFSHDVCMRVQLTRYGGYGYGHLLDNVVPMLLNRGIDRDTIDTILVENPRRVLTFREPVD